MKLIKPNHITISQIYINSDIFYVKVNNHTHQGFGRWEDGKKTFRIIDYNDFLPDSLKFHNIPYLDDCLHILISSIHVKEL